MCFPMVSSKKRGTMRFYRPWPKPSSVKSPVDVGQIFLLQNLWTLWISTNWGWGENKGSTRYEISVVLNMTLGLQTHLLVVACFTLSTKDLNPNLSSEYHVKCTPKKISQDPQQIYFKLQWCTDDVLCLDWFFQYYPPLWHMEFSCNSHFFGV